MMGTQLWLKESLFDFLNSLLGGVEEKTGSSNQSDLDKQLQDVVAGLDKKGSKGKKSPKVFDLNPKKADGLADVKEKLRDGLFKGVVDKDGKYISKTGKQQSENDTAEEDLKSVDVRNWSALVDDNSSKRDAKVENLADKLKRYKKSGYID